MTTSGKEARMPALQVRDFPDDLYERLKACAALEHRSVAQQTVALVEEGLNARNESHFWDGCELHRLGRAPQVIDFDTESARAVRIEKRKALFAEFEKLPKFTVPDTFPSTAELIRQGREERDQRILGAADYCGEEALG